MKLLISTLMVLLLTLAGTQALAEEGWIKVYLGDSERNQVSASGSCTIVVTPKGGAKKILKAQLVEPNGSALETKLNHGGQVIGRGEYTIELVVAKAEEAHGHAATGHGHGEAEEHSEATDSNEGLPYFQAPFSPTQYACPMNDTPPADSPGKCPTCGMALEEKEVAFDAVVIIKTDKGTFNVKGFEYPFLDYSSIVSMMEAHLDEIQELIDSGQLLKVHPVASKISRLAESLPNAKDFPEDDRSKVESTCKEIISLFAEIDKAADAEKKAETIQVLDKYRNKVTALEKYAHEEPGHGEHDH